MATVYRAPEAYKPNYRSATYLADEAAYVERQKAAARKANPGDKLAGTIHRLTVADGFATYIVWSSKPLKLVHLEIGDGYAAPAAYIRGLRLSDIKLQAKQDAEYAKLFAARVDAVGR